MKTHRLLALMLAVVLIAVAVKPAPAEALEPNVILLIAGAAVAIILVVVVVIIANVRSSQRGVSSLMPTEAQAAPEQNTFMVMQTVPDQPGVLFAPAVRDQAP